MTLTPERVLEDWSFRRALKRAEAVSVAFLALWSRVGVGKLYNILTVGTKLFNFHNLHTIHYVSLGLGLDNLFSFVTLQCLDTVVISLLDSPYGCLSITPLNEPVISPISVISLNEFLAGLISCGYRH